MKIKFKDYWEKNKDDFSSLFKIVVGVVTIWTLIDLAKKHLGWDYKTTLFLIIVLALSVPAANLLQFLIDLSTNKFKELREYLSYLKNIKSEIEELKNEIKELKNNVEGKNVPRNDKDFGTK